ncbi:hypothetical protein N7471_008335 [Penicillium samsonianum]|uniref:uncharacterized protein n=1 Tax=Penicillium samsonianum TaxID=1882272 RepID=UPI0025487487|nr:uncharacterized protein N7471_008335 [Penicillium samsonianum]KAJ6133120.1 hypothetical protein N7471_008335 [Penicillium samsonianum]
MVTTTRAMKRSASTLQGAPGLDVALPEMIVSRPSFSLPYTHYAMIYIDHEGRLKTYESQSIQEQDTGVFNPKVCQNFLEILGERIGCHQPIDQTLPRRLRRRTSNTNTISASEERLDEQRFDSNNFNGSVVEMVPLRVGDTKMVMVYYEDTLKRLLQFNCCVILKAFIKVIEPRKKAKHPYNGKPPRGSAPGTRCDPEKTKPEWWPSGVMHKEPDHMAKADRIELLLHILRKLGGRGIIADILEEIVRDAKRNLKGPRNVEIIYELLRVRKMEELFERGEVDANKVVYIMNPSSSIKEDDSANTASVVMGVPRHKELGLTLGSVEQGSTTLTTTTKGLASASVYALPGSSMPLNFEVADRLDNSDYKMPPEYTNSFLQPILSTTMISDTPVSRQNTFPGCTSDHQHTEAPGHYGGWIDTNSYQNVASPEDYGSLATSQSTTMHSQRLMGSTSFCDMDYYNTISQGSQPFYLGSIGHPNGLPLYYYA